MKAGQCPICDGKEFNFLINGYVSPDNVSTFEFKKNEKIISCKQCGAFLKTPLEIDIDDFREYGRKYYNQSKINLNADEEKTIKAHIMNNQIPIYNAFKKYLYQRFDSKIFYNWLDVGSAGYPTTFREYNFKTIEPDDRTVKIGQELFESKNIECNILEHYHSEEKLDAILFHHSFYCMPNPNVTIKKAYELLDNNGIIVIAIGQFFMDTTPPYVDYKYLRLEDLFRGVTSYIYYNDLSLEYIFAKHNFKLIEKKVLEHTDFEAIKKYESKYFVFQKQSKIEVKNTLIQESKIKYEKMIDSLFNEWFDNSLETLKSFNTFNTIFIGSYTVFQQLNEIYPLDNIYGFYDWGYKLDQNINLDNINFITKKDLKNFKNGNIVVCSFDSEQDKIVKFVNSLKDETCTLFLPSRSSAIENMFFKYQAQNRLTKSFSVTMLD